MTLDEKIAKAKVLISTRIKKYKNPIVFSSFGKDSMVMLDLIKKTGHKLPLIFHREPYGAKKYEFSNSVILENDYSVYDYPPLYTKIAKKNDDIEIVSFYQIGKEASYMPTGVKEPIDDNFLCSLNDIYNKPKGTFSFPWDLAFVGHKNTDTDPILGDVPLKDNIHYSASCTFVFPLIDFTNEDIWNYAEKERIPINLKRYNKYNKYKEFDDITYNPDYFHMCTRCIDRDKEEFVVCPKTGESIPNISYQLSYIEPITLPYFRR